MNPTWKLKPDRSIGGWIIPLAAIFLIGSITLIFDFSIALWVLSGIFLVFAAYNLVIFIRTGNTGMLVACLYDLFVASMLGIVVRYLQSPHLARKEWIAAWAAGMLFFSVLLVFLAVTKRIKWRGREIFELAAQPVDETGDGYTSRPRPVGRVKFGRDELLAFARFCSRRLIALSYPGDQQVHLVPVRMGKEDSFLLRSSGRILQDATWVAFSYSGEVTVHIAQRDYLEYTEQLAFDKLCDSLGKLFIEFAELHQRGEGVRILDRLDSLGLVYFT